jgi:hypothetical protein
MAFAAIYDACVLYPAPLRDLLVELAAMRCIRARWTDRIHDEWIRSVLAAREDVTEAQLARTRALMDKAVEDVLVTGYENLEMGLALPDLDDRHVLAAAIRASAEVIVTFNLKDFPAETLATYEVEAQHPDDFLRHFFDLYPGQLCAAARRCRLRLKKPPKDVKEMLETYRQQGLTRTTAALEDMIELL